MKDRLWGLLTKVISPLIVRAKSSTAWFHWWDMCYSIGTCAYMHMSPEIVGATDSISSVRAAFSTGIKWGPH